MDQFDPLNGEEVKKEVCRIIERAGLSFRTEEYSAINSSIIGKRRRVDVVIVDGDTVLMHIECKAQNSSGSAEDKLFKAVQEANRDKQNGIPSIIVFSGFGWNEADMRHALLNGSVRIEMFEDWLKLYFRYSKLKPDSIHAEISVNYNLFGE